MKRYLMLFVVALGAAAILFAIGRRTPASAPADVAASDLRAVDLELVITREHRLEPQVVAVPKDHRVRLTVWNRDIRPVSLTLMGYQDRFAIQQVPPDSAWRGTFVADRPGEDFAWMLEGAPVGRLEVRGSHLVEGHR